MNQSVKEYLASIGRKGGQSVSPAKRNAAIINGSTGGRKRLAPRQRYIVVQVGQELHAITAGNVTLIEARSDKEAIDAVAQSQFRPLHRKGTLPLYGSTMALSTQPSE